MITDQMVELVAAELSKYDVLSGRVTHHQVRDALTAGLGDAVVVPREAGYKSALEEIGRYAKRIRKSRDLIGPVEYVHDEKSMRVWQRALYHEGKTLEGMVKAALHGSDIFEPEKGATVTRHDDKGAA